MVLATQNPVEFEGTYPLPEAQLDRFVMRLELGYPSMGRGGGDARRDAGGDPLVELEPVADLDDVRRRAAAAARCPSRAASAATSSPPGASRAEPPPELGASPRAAMRCPRRKAPRSSRPRLCRARRHKAVAAPVLSHRLIFGPEARSASLEAPELVADVLERTPVPV